MKILAVALAMVTAGCSQAGNLGEILGGVMNAPAGNQVSGTIQGVDTRSQVVFVRQGDGQSVGFRYDGNTRVVYQDQNYPVTALENGDQVTLRYEASGNTYYTDYIQVTQSVTSGNGNAGSGQVYSLQGTVRSVDRTNGYFTISVQNGILTVSMPYNPRSSDVNRFNQLRTGEYVQFQGVYLNDTRVELRSFN